MKNRTWLIGAKRVIGCQIRVIAPTKAEAIQKASVGDFEEMYDFNSDIEIDKNDVEDDGEGVDVEQ